MASEKRPSEKQGSSVSAQVAEESLPSLFGFCQPALMAMSDMATTSSDVMTVGVPHRFS
jgi:hypothetical protein